MARLIITCALGHIGSRLIRTIDRDVFGRILLLDNLSSQPYASLMSLPSGMAYTFLEADVCTADLSAILERDDVVVHLAAITDAESSFERAREVERVNLEGTERVARACAARGAKVLFLSTTSVYGPQSAVVDEECSPAELRPQSPYADSKLRAEQLLFDLGRDADLAFVACRFGTIVGPSVGMRFHTAVNKFIWQACLGRPLTVWRTALDQKRPYLDLTDAVRAIRFLIDRDQFTRRVFNVLTLNATVRQIVEAIRARVPGVRVELVDSPIMNQLSYEVSRRRMESLGFSFQGDIDRGIGETIDLLREGTGLAIRYPP